MDTFHTWGYYIAKVKMLVDPGLYQLLFIKIKPGSLDIADLFQMIGGKLLLELLLSLVEGLLIRWPHHRMPESIKLVPHLRTPFWG
jgi:hypothetical protein